MVTKDELARLLAHPAIDLDFAGLGLVTGLDRRNVRRLGTPGWPVPQSLLDWIAATVAADPDGRRRRRLRIAAWIERRTGSNPPPWLSEGREEPPPGAWPEPGAGEARVIEDRRQRFT